MNAWRVLLLTMAVVTADVAAKDPIVTVRAPDSVAVQPGDTTTAVVSVVVADGFHIQANPAGGEFLIPLEIILFAPDSILSYWVRYPPPQHFRLEGAEEDLLTYADSVAVEVFIAAPVSAAPGELKLAGTVRYQACDNRRCFFPATVPIAFTARIAH